MEPSRSNPFKAIHFFLLKPKIRHLTIKNSDFLLRLDTKESLPYTLPNLRVMADFGGFWQAESLSH